MQRWTIFAFMAVPFFALCGCAAVSDSGAGREARLRIAAADCVSHVALRAESAALPGAVHPLEVYPRSPPHDGSSTETFGRKGKGA